MISNKIDKRLFERVIQKYDKATILNELKKETIKKWDMEVFTTYGGISYSIERTPEGWRFAVDGHDSGRRWETRPNIEKVVGNNIKRIDRYKWSDDGDDWHEVEYPERDSNYIGGVGKNNHRAIRESYNYLVEGKYGSDPMTLKDIIVALIGYGVHTITVKEYPEFGNFLDHCKIDDLDTNRKKSVDLSIVTNKDNTMIGARLYYFDVDRKARIVDFGRNMSKETAMNMTKCLRKILKDVEEEYDSYLVPNYIKSSKDFLDNIKKYVRNSTPRNFSLHNKNVGVEVRELGEKEIDANLNYIIDVTMIPNNPQCRLTFAIDENGYIRYTNQYGADECRTLPIPKTFIKWDKIENIIYNFMRSY